MLILSGFILAGQNIMPLYLADNGEAMDKMAVFLNGDRACFKKINNLRRKSSWDLL